MKKTSKTVVFFGNERLATGVTTAAPTLQALIKNGYTIAAVVSNHATSTSRNSRKLEIETIAKQHNIPFLLPNKPSEIIEELHGLKASVGVLVAYGKIVPQSVIDIFPFGIVNIHPSELPLHRGPTPVESVILDGSKQTAVSIMKLVKAMDAGPVYAQQKVSLTGTETKQELADRLLDIGGNLIIQNLPAILDGTLEPKEQNEAAATFDQLLSKQDGIIDWNKPAMQIEREIRAYAEWPKSRTVLATKDVVITKAHVIPTDVLINQPGTIEAVGNTLVITCGQESLCVDTLKPAGKNEMTAAAFIAGYGQNL